MLHVLFILFFPCLKFLTHIEINTVSQHNKETDNLSFCTAGMIKYWGKNMVLWL